MLPACASETLKHRIPASRLRDMSRQGQIWVYDAENEIVVALDQLDEALDLQHNTERRLKQAEAQRKSVEKRQVPGANQVAQAWSDYLERFYDWATAQVALRRLGIVVARAAFELAKAQIVQKEDLLAGKDFSLKSFRDQHERLVQLFERRVEALKKLRQLARDQEARWWAARRQLTGQTGNHDIGLWVD